MKLKRRSFRDRRLYLILDLVKGQSPSIDRLKAALNSGADMIQLRAKGIPDKSFLEYAMLLRGITARSGCFFIVNDRADIAVACGADGLHIGQEDIDPASARKMIGSGRILGLSTGSIEQVRSASWIKDIDYIGLGPVFQTRTKDGARPIGLDIVRSVARSGAHKRLTVFAIGGIDTENISKLIAAGIKHVAVSSAVFGSGDPAKVVTKFREILYDTD